MSAPGLIVELVVCDRDVLVVGAGPVGRRRAASLLALGARLRWVAPNAPDRYTARPFVASDCIGIEYVFACAPPAVNQRVEVAASTHGAILCRADAPADMRMLGVLHRGALRIAISTAGRAPAAARAIVKALEPRVPVGWGSLVEVVAELRSRLPAGPERTRHLRAALQGPLAAVLESGSAPDRAAVNRWLDRQSI